MSGQPKEGLKDMQARHARELDALRTGCQHPKEHIVKKGEYNCSRRMLAYYCEFCGCEIFSELDPTANNAEWRRESRPVAHDRRRKRPPVA